MIIRRVFHDGIEPRSRTDKDKEKNREGKKMQQIKTTIELLKKKKNSISCRTSEIKVVPGIRRDTREQGDDDLLYTYTKKKGKVLKKYTNKQQ